MKVNEKIVMSEASLKMKDLVHTKKKNVYILRLLDKLLRKCSIQQVTFWLASHQRFTNYSLLPNKQCISVAYSRGREFGPSPRKYVVGLCNCLT